MNTQTRERFSPVKEMIQSQHYLWEKQTRPLLQSLETNDLASYLSLCPDLDEDMLYLNLIDKPDLWHSDPLLLKMQSHLRDKRPARLGQRLGKQALDLPAMPELDPALPDLAVNHKLAWAWQLMTRPGQASLLEDTCRNFYEQIPADPAAAEALLNELSRHAGTEQYLRAFLKVGSNAFKIKILLLFKDSWYEWNIQAQPLLFELLNTYDPVLVSQAACQLFELSQHEPEGNCENAEEEISDVELLSAEPTEPAPKTDWDYIEHMAMVHLSESLSDYELEE